MTNDSQNKSTHSTCLMSRFRIKVKKANVKVAIIHSKLVERPQQLLMAQLHALNRAKALLLTIVL